jgi:hypothetical protein
MQIQFRFHCCDIEITLKGVWGYRSLSLNVKQAGVDIARSKGYLLSWGRDVRFGRGC